MVCSTGKTVRPNVDKLTSNQKVSIMQLFSEVYSLYSCENIAMREAMCLKAQYPATMCDIEDGDLFAGRLIHLPIGFCPQVPYGFGYYYSDEHCNKLLSDKDLTDKNKDILHNLMAFWCVENTAYKVRNAYPLEMQRYLPNDDFENESGIGFPLYRMSGSQLDLDKLITKGIPGLLEELELNKHKDINLFDSMKLALETLIDVCMHYKEQALRMAESAIDKMKRCEFRKMADTLENITKHAPTSFREAIQLVHLYVLLSGSKNYGRMDIYLGDLYVNDIENHRIDQKYALMLLESFWKMIIVRNDVFDSRVVIGGLGRRNESNADRFSILAMEASKNIKEVCPQLTLRCYKGMDTKVYDKALEVIGTGTTFPMLYNDDVNIPSAQKAFDISYEEAVDYIPFGCGEYILYHRSFGTPSGAINLLQALNVTLRNGIDPVGQNIQGLQLGKFEDFNTFDEFYDAYCKQVEFFVELLADQEELEYKIAAENASYLYFSMLYDDCIQRGKAIFSGGIHYLGGTLETYGNTNTADSLTAIKVCVFDNKDISKEELLKALEADFVGYEHIQKLLLDAPKYGNDDEIADDMAQKHHNFICNIIRNQKNRTNLDSYLTVIINNEINTIFGLNTGASPDGRKAGVYMANANNPMNGMDKNGITATLNSLVKLDTSIHAGSVQNMKFSKEMFGELLPKTKALLDTYFSIGGSQTMITVLCKEDLKNAIKEPEKYSNLIVRVGGFSARFVELKEEVQKEILNRTLY